MDNRAVPTEIAAAMEQWSKFISHALTARLSPDEFASYARLLRAKQRLPPFAVADLLLCPKPTCHHSLDSRVHQYLYGLLKLGLVDIQSALRALYKYSSLQAYSQHAPAGEGEANGTDEHTHKKAPLRWTSSSASEETIFFRLAKNLSQEATIKASVDALQLVSVVSRWCTLFTDAATAFSSDAFGAIHSLQAKTEMEHTRSAFLMLLLTVCENHSVLEALSKPFAKGARKLLSTSLESFAANIIQSAAEVASRLELFRTQTLAAFEPVDTKEKEPVDADMNGLLDLMGSENLQVPDIPVVNSRAGLYIYLNAALVGRPLIDDHALYSYLHGRFQGDLQQTAIQLILASFDVLANAVFRNEGAKDGHLLKSYVVNKVPLILRSLVATSTMYPLNAEFCITEALSQVDTNVFPTLSNMFDMSNTNSSFHDSVRQDFCFSCQLHGLLSESATETLLGEITYQSLPDEGRYVKETLVQTCLEDPEKTLKLIGELDNMNGNVGAAAQAIIEVIGSLCRNKETMTLKQICSLLASKPLSLDILLLFDKASKILHPLCELLDNWRYDDDGNEYQTVYEDFSSVLLLLFAFVYRYGLTPADLGVCSPDSCVGGLLSRGNLSKSMQELSEEEKAHLNIWIHGLFDSDAGGLGDELMSSCPPQEFYMIIPTLFHQIVLALVVGYLSEDALRGGLDYLVDTFLLPALVPALLFLSAHLWATNEHEQRAILRVFRLIIRPQSGETSAGLSSVLNVVARPLEQSLRTYQRQHPKSQDIEPLLRGLREYIPLSRRTGAADHNELESWTSGGLAASIRHTVQNLATWGQHQSINGMPTSYTHRQILVAQKVLGAKQVLATMVDELKQQTEASNGSVAYDVVTGLICAPDAANDASLATPAIPDETGVFPPLPQRRLALRDVLRAEADDWKRLSKADLATAETVVRLHRRVEAQMLQLQPPPETMLQPTLELGGDVLDKAIAAAAAADPTDAMTLDTTGLDGVADLGLAGGDLGLGSATNSAGGLDLTSDDIFGGLGGATDFNTDFSSWDTMDLG